MFMILWYLPLILMIYLSIRSLVSVFKAPPPEDKGSFEFSKIMLIIFGLMVFILIAGLLFLYNSSMVKSADIYGAVILGIFYVIAGLLATLFGTLSTMYTSMDNNKDYQSRRKWILLIGTVLIYLPLFFSLGRYYVEQTKTGVIGGISQEKAIKIADQQISPLVNHKFLRAKKIDNWSNDAAAWEVTYEIKNKRGEYVLNYMVMVSAVDGSILNLNDKVELTILNNGKPYPDVEVETIKGRDGGGNTIVIKWDYEYGITDENGKVKLDLPNYNNEQYYFWVILPDGSKVFSKIAQPHKESYTLDVKDLVISPSSIQTSPQIVPSGATWR